MIAYFSDSTKRNDNCYLGWAREKCWKHKVYPNFSTITTLIQEEDIIAF